MGTAERMNRGKNQEGMMGIADRRIYGGKQGGVGSSSNRSIQDSERGDMTLHIGASKVAIEGEQWALWMEEEIGAAHT